jgi:nicotinate dehydrogenase subunit A
VAQRIELNVDGKVHAIEAEPDMPLLYALRDDIGLKNPRFGCGLSQCGACTVLINGQPVRSCSMPVGSVGAGKVVTLNGIGTPEKPHKIQAAFIEEQVPQCGYCLNGWIMTSVALLEKNPKPSDAEIREALTGIKCRCGTHVGVLRAVKRAAQA